MTCQQCGREFTGRKRKYCTPQCRQAYFNTHRPPYVPKPKVQWDCVVCGELVVRDSGPRGKYCAVHKDSNANANMRGHRARRKAIERRDGLPTHGHRGFSWLRRSIAERDGWLCGICHTLIDSKLSYPDPMSVSLDHIKPLMVGGRHVEDNLQVAHLRCNILRSNQLMAQLGRMTSGDMRRFISDA
jgi:HNH endonuclease